MTDPYRTMAIVPAEKVNLLFDPPWWRMLWLIPPHRKVTIENAKEIYRFEQVKCWKIRHAKTYNNPSPRHGKVFYTSTGKWVVVMGGGAFFLYFADSLDELIKDCRKRESSDPKTATALKVLKKKLYPISKVEIRI